MFKVGKRVPADLRADAMAAVKMQPPSLDACPTNISQLSDTSIGECVASKGKPHPKNGANNKRKSSVTASAAEEQPPHPVLARPGSTAEGNNEDAFESLAQLGTPCPPASVPRGPSMMCWQVST